MSRLIAVAAALGGSVVFGISSVAEQRGTKRVKRRRALSPRILLDLARQPLWVAAIGGTLVGFSLQVVALTFGPLALVQPILVCDLIFAVLINSYLRRRRDPVMLAGVAACAAGVAGFLVIARPSGGQSTVSFHIMLPLAAGLTAGVAGCLIVARRNQDLRPLALALACGINYGAAAFLVKLVTSQAGGGLAHLLGNWPIYALAVIAPVGFVLNQDAFQQGTLLGPVLAIITSCDPIVSIALAHLWLNEKLSGSPAAIAGEVVSLLLMVTGIAVLARHSPHATRQVEAAGRADATARPSPDLIARPQECPGQPSGHPGSGRSEAEPEPVPAQDGPEPQHGRTDPGRDERDRGDGAQQQERGGRLRRQQHREAGGEQQEDAGPEPGCALKEAVQPRVMGGGLPQGDHFGGQLSTERPGTPGGASEQDAQAEVRQREVQQEDPQIAGGQDHCGLDGEHDRRNGQQAGHRPAAEPADDDRDPRGGKPGQQRGVPSGQPSGDGEGGDGDSQRFAQAPAHDAQELERPGQFQVLGHPTSIRGRDQPPAPQGLRKVTNRRQRVILPDRRNS
ncbi:MAG TPA: DMT family transporter [Streptosporangiaceae bacterium]|nr:DMT family transporter [Streptosporangiaceae bacterium]